jgi:hypothetical protein
MYHVETRADNSEYTNHRVICLVVIVNKYSKFQTDTFDSFWEMDSDTFHLKIIEHKKRDDIWHWKFQILAWDSYINVTR